MPDCWPLVPATRAERRRLVGEWLVWRYRRAAADRGTQPVARQLRKQGIPIGIALRILGIAPTLPSCGEPEHGSLPRRG